MSYYNINMKKAQNKRNIMNKADINKKKQNLIELAFSSYKKVKNSMVVSYDKIEENIVKSYTKIEDEFVGRYLIHDDETIEEAKIRLKEINEKEKEN